MFGKRYLHSKLAYNRTKQFRLTIPPIISAVVNSLTNHRITPEIIPVRSLRKSLMINGSLYTHDILTAYSLGRIHHKIFRLNESLIFLVNFPIPFPIIYRCINFLFCRDLKKGVI